MNDYLEGTVHLSAAVTRKSCDNRGSHPVPAFPRAPSRPLPSLSLSPSPSRPLRFSLTSCRLRTVAAASDYRDERVMAVMRDYPDRKQPPLRRRSEQWRGTCLTVAVSNREAHGRARGTRLARWSDRHKIGTTAQRERTPRAVLNDVIRAARKVAANSR